MRRILSIIGVAALAAGLGVTAMVTDGAQASPRPSRPDAVARAERAVDQHPAAVKASRHDRFIVRGVFVDPDDATHVRYDRRYKGLPVLGGDFVVDNAPDGTFTSANVQLHEPISVNTAPSLSRSKAKATAKAHFTGTAERAGKPHLVVDAGRDGHDARLAWEIVVHGTRPDGQTPSRLHVLVDARDGTVLYAFDEIRTGTGHGVYVGTVKIDTQQSGGGYEMVDPSHGNGETCDMNNRKFGCELFTDEDDEWGDGDPSNPQSAAVDAHYGAATTYDYYNEVHGRNGVFGDGRGVPSRVHYGNAYANAFWDGSQMTYGDGRYNQWPLTSLDVAGHEMSHGVTQELAGLVYSGESGGLNESTSDIFGSMVEFYAGNSEDTPDYEIGESINIRGDGEPLRYLYNPSLDGRSYNCWQPGIGNSNVHYSSGVGNHFFFLLAEGSGGTKWGTSPTCDGSQVTGIGHKKAAAIWFRALKLEFGGTTDYHGARSDTLAAAADLYGKDSTASKTVAAAWDAVAVTAQ